MKTSTGNFFEDFNLGQTIAHATPRTVTAGDQAVYQALYGSRFAVQSSDEFARALGYPSAPIDDLLVFHIVFGKTVPDISLNAIANLGYAEARFLRPVYPGDTLTATSTVIGLNPNSNGRTGTVYVRSTGYNQLGEEVLTFARWVMVRRREEGGTAQEGVVPALPKSVPPDRLGAACPSMEGAQWDPVLAGSFYRFSDYTVGERIDHVDGVTVEEAEPMLAARLYQNTARVHFNAFSEGKGKPGRRLIYGGHVISLARALSFNGLGNCFHIAGINGGKHVAPLFAGATVFAWSEIKAKADIPGRNDLGALRIVTRATRDQPTDIFPTKAASADDPGVILEFDYWALIPR